MVQVADTSLTSYLTAAWGEEVDRFAELTERQFTAAKRLAAQQAFRSCVRQEMKDVEAALWIEGVEGSNETARKASLQDKAAHNPQYQELQRQERNVDQAIAGEEAELQRTSNLISLSRRQLDWTIMVGRMAAADADPPSRAQRGGH